jgi:hypothetical protein
MMEVFVHMKKILSVPVNAFILSLIHFLWACGSKSERTAEEVDPKSDSLRTKAFDRFVDMARLSCAYTMAEALSSPEIAETECENAATRKLGAGQWKAEWKRDLGDGLASRQFDSLCVNFIRATSGEPPLPVSDKVLAGGRKLAAMNDAAVKDLLKRAD